MKNEINNYININLEDFDYNLPENLIPKYPTKDRNGSKLLYADINSRNIQHLKFNDINELIPENSTLIINSTKVIAARIFMTKPTGGKAEVLCVNPVEPSVDPQIVMQTKNNCIWECIIGGKRIKEGLILKIEEIGFHAEIIERYDNKAKIKFEWDENISFGDMLNKIGKIPLPPYIKRETEDQDKERYQTVYARTGGSVAAPTAGLHFTEDILNNLKNKKVNIEEIILHVGPGTFVPVEGEVSEHKMHKERVYIPIETIENIIDALKKNNNIIATGTTSVRTIESLFWAGQKISENIPIEYNGHFVSQWDPYQTYNDLLNTADALEVLVNDMQKKNISILSGETSLFILPRYDFKIINGIITNFHLPKSTLILLVSAFTGEDMWRKIYDNALNEKYRFLSYGDSSFLFKKK